MKQREVATANLAAAISLGLAAGTVGAGVIAQWWDWRGVYVAVGAACAVLAGAQAATRGRAGSGHRQTDSYQPPQPMTFSV